MALDYHATPFKLVDAMMGAVSGRDFDVLLDPAAGDGRLLHAAQELFSRAACVAVDLDESRTAALHRDQGDWDVRTGDFLELVTAPLGNSRTLVVMNPPFSGRGGTRWQSSMGADRVHCSRPMAFLVAAANACAGNGEVVALVPAGVVTNRRDASARDTLASAGTLAVLEVNPPSAFPGVATRTAIVRWTSICDDRVAQTKSARVIPVDHGPVWITRGTLAVHRARDRETDDSGIAFLHTRSQDRPGRQPAVRHIDPRPCERIVRSPCVLLPRVGAPVRERVVLHRGGPVVLSDCLFALECTTLTSTRRLLQQIRHNWEDAASRYGGSCAPFLRLDDLVALVADLGWSPAGGPAPDSTWKLGRGNRERAPMVTDQARRPRAVVAAWA